jgi:RNA polymerase sigma factor (sigma-70 family)
MPDALLDWPELLARLERDLVSDDSMRDEEAWLAATRRVHAYARKVGRWDVRVPQEELDEIAQDLLLKLLSVDFVRQLREVKSAQNYLFAVIRNAAHDRARRERRQGDREAIVEKEVYRLPSELARPDPNDPDESAGYRLEDALKQLGDSDRRLLHDHYWKQIPIAELARVNHLKYSAVAVRLHRARQKLERALAALTDESDD